MQLDQLQAVLRRRQAFEALDLGLAMVRRWWRPIYASWLVGVLPWYLVVWAILFAHPLWAALLLWWLKPLWDRIPLFVISRALFGDLPSPDAAVRAAPGLWRGQLALSLFLYRLDPVRSFFLPVLQLERSPDSARRRRAVLSQGSFGVASWLTFCCICLEGVVLLGLVGLLLIMLPDTPEWTLTSLWEQFQDDGLPLPLRGWYHLSAFLALALVEPVYVACGFALYLNRRTELEGWDIELIFRQMAARLQAPSPRPSLGPILLLLAAATLAPGGLAHGQTAEPPEGAAAAPETTESPEGAAAETGQPAELIADVLSRPEFDRREHRRRWRLKNPDREQEMPPWGAALAKYLAPVLEGLIWVVFGVVLASLAYVVLTFRGRGPVARRRPALEPPVSLQPETELPVPLPARLAQRAWELWQQGQGEAALSLLYRGTLDQLAGRFGVDFPRGATEGDCLCLARDQVPSSVAHFFGQLTNSWVAQAYAHRSPSSDTVQGLCRRWPELFPEGP